MLLRQFWWVPLITTLLGLAGGGAYLHFKDPEYTSVGRLWATGTLSLPQTAVFSEDVQNYFGTQIALLESDRLQRLAFQRVTTANPTLAPTDPDGRPIPVKIRAMQATRSTIINIVATGPTPEYTQTYLDALMGVFLDLKREVRAQASGETLTSLTEQLRRQEQELKAEQEKLIAFRRDNNLAMLQEQGNAAGAYVVKLISQLADYQLEYRLLGAAAVEVDYLPSATNLVVADGTITNAVDIATGSPEAQTNEVAAVSGGSPALHQAQQELELLRIQRDRLAQYLRPAHPKMIRLTEEIERGERILQLSRDQNAEQLAATRQSLEIKIQTLIASIQEWELKLGQANSALVEYDRLQQNVERMQSLRDRLLPLLQSIDVNRNIDQDSITVLDPASPALPARTELPKTLALALFFGLGAGLGLVFLIEKADDRLMSCQDVTRQFNEELVGQLPEVRPSRKDPRPVLIERDDPRHAFAESCRSLRSSLLFGCNPEDRPKTLLVTSAEPGEGKSTVAANLARTLAFSGARVLLIDADLRRSSIHRLFQVEREPGLGNLLEQQADPGQFPFIRQTNVPNLFLVTSGTAARNCGELLLSNTFDAFLDHVRQEFDFAVFDTIPVLASDDATTLAPKLDGVLFVVRGGRSRARVVRQALDLLHQRQAAVLGLVLNRSDGRTGHYGYYNYPEYHQTPNNGKPQRTAKPDGKPKDKRPSLLAWLFSSPPRKGRHTEPAPRIVIQPPKD